MEYDNLVDFIYQEVKKKLNSIEEINSNLDSNSKSKTAIVLWDNDQNHYKSIMHVFDIKSFEDRKQNYDIVIISALCLRGLSTLALATNVSTEERFILTSLLKGKKVYVLEDGVEYKKYKNTAPKSLYNKYLDYEKQIKTYGVQFISNVDEILKDQSNNTVAQFHQEEKKIHVEERQNNQGMKQDRIEKKLITESDLNKLLIHGVKTVQIGKSSIITPLAEDFMRNHKMVIHRID